MSENLYIVLIDELFNFNKEIKIERPKAYNLLLVEIEKNFKLMPLCYQAFYLSENYKEIEINNNKTYRLSKDIVFIREIKVIDLDESLFEKNYNKLTEEKQEKLDDKFNCLICNIAIKNENPYFCYECQKIFHIKCLEDWNSKRKIKNQELNCMFCRKELPLEKWNKKLDFEESRKNEAENMEKINELTKLNKIKSILIKINNEKINELQKNINSKANLIGKYEKFKQKIFLIIDWILSQINKINSSTYPLNNGNLKAKVNYYGEEMEIKLPKSFRKFIQSVCNMLQIQEVEIKNFKIYYKKEKSDKEVIINNLKNYISFLIEVNNNNINIFYIELLDSKNDKSKENKDFCIEYNYDKKMINLINAIKDLKLNFSSFPLYDICFNINEEIEIMKMNIKDSKMIKKLNTFNNINFPQRRTLTRNTISYCNILEPNKIFLQNKNDYNIFNKKEKIIIIKKKDENNNISNVIRNKYNNEIKINNNELNKKNNNEIKNTYSKNEEVKIEYKNEINLIYFTEKEGLEKIFGKKFIENNQKNIDLIINGEKIQLKDEYKLKKGENTVKIIINNRILNLESIFYECKSLKNIDELKYLDTREITNFSYMFSQFSLITNLKALKYWEISKVKTFKGMFYGCSSIKDLKPLENWNVSNINDFSYMFYGCSALTNINPLKKWNISKGNNFSDMFRNCTSLSNIESLEKWNISNGIYFQNMFFECLSLKDIKPLKNWNVSNGVNFNYMFCNCSLLTDITPLENWNFSNCTSLEGILSRCTELTNINPLKNWSVSKCNNFSFLFNMCVSLSNLEPLKNWDVSNGTDFQSMLRNCSSLSDISALQNWNVSNGKLFKYMFFDCSSLSDLRPLEKWNVSEGTNFEGMFSECHLIESLKSIENWNVKNGKNFNKMFYIKTTIDINKDCINKWNLRKDIIDSMFFQD